MLVKQTCSVVSIYIKIYTYMLYVNLCYIRFAFSLIFRVRTCFQIDGEICMCNLDVLLQLCGLNVCVCVAAWWWDDDGGLMHAALHTSAD